MLICGAGIDERFCTRARVPGRSQIPSGDMIATLSNKKKNQLSRILEHASGDKRFKILEAHIKKHQFKQDALIVEVWMRSDTLLRLLLLMNHQKKLLSWLQVLQISLRVSLHRVIRWY